MREDLFGEVLAVFDIDFPLVFVCCGDHVLCFVVVGDEEGGRYGGGGGGGSSSSRSTSTSNSASP